MWLRGVRGWNRSCGRYFSGSSEGSGVCSSIVRLSSLGRLMRLRVGMWGRSNGYGAHQTAGRKRGRSRGHPFRRFKLLVVPIYLSVRLNEKVRVVLFQ